MKIDAQFDSGNIEVEEISGNQALLSIRADTGAEYYQWFYFRVTDDPNIEHNFKITNAAGASYPHAWDGYRVLASYDENDWFRVSTDYDGTNLNFRHQPTQATTSYAFFVPYLASRRETLLKGCEASPHASVRSLGVSVQNRSMDVTVIGAENRPVKKVWLVARQHAGEPMTEWVTEGLLRRLLDTEDAIARSLLDKATFYVVPNMNPDGSTLGNLRANARGVDLNRAWDQASADCPEIGAVLAEIERTGVDYFFDVHGDEARPYIWIASARVAQPPEVKNVQERFDQALSRLTPEIGPPPPSVVGETMAAPGMSVNYITSRYDCPVWLFELPFKETGDLTDDPDSLLADGCKRFGRSCLEALDTIID